MSKPLHVVRAFAVAAVALLPAARAGAAAPADKVVCVSATLLLPPGDGPYRITHSIALDQRLSVSMDTFGKIARCMGGGRTGSSRYTVRFPYLPRYGPVLHHTVTLVGCSASGHRVYASVVLDVTSHGSRPTEMPSSGISSALCSD